MVMAVDSVWNRNAGGGPYGGGNIGLDPPCIYDPNYMSPQNQYGDTRYAAEEFQDPKWGFYWYGAWEPSFPLNWNVFGGAWPWHSNGTIANVTFMDSHTKGMSISQMTKGCNVQDFWGGNITNESQYIWGFRQ